ncbi:unnamed protein product [Agarophyton chilense]|eukprot:gb/GEZJ01005305.1/.p1 GENE.gb/GEZJ01005305.1/~~gb/GEZJ01005305.1/.p1  ORF type:complete len:361 (-),score=28.72 gb/GEZJ01005305.1/:277-1359(-)
MDDHVGHFHTSTVFNRLLPPNSRPCVIGQGRARCYDMTFSRNYVNSYAHFAIHETMLKDSVRTNTFRNAIVQNQHLFRSKVVLDVGCGTGILSCFAAQAGAARVYAVDCSHIVDQTRLIVQNNGLSDIITVIESPIERLQLPEQVDIIVSEWMGYFLLDEFMLPSVILARDTWLKPDGLMFPDHATISLCGCDDADLRADKLDFWHDVSGFDMSCMKNFSISEPAIEIVPNNHVTTTTHNVLSLDLATCTPSDLRFASSFQLRALKRNHLQAIVGFFTVSFTYGTKKIHLRTGPMHRPTHWKQTIFFLDQPMPMEKNECITGVIAVQQNKNNKRDLDIGLEYKFNGSLALRCNILRYRLR